jgi:hypothetical protein
MLAKASAKLPNRLSLFGYYIGRVLVGYWSLRKLSRVDVDDL